MTPRQPEETCVVRHRARVLLQNSTLSLRYNPVCTVFLEVGAGLACGAHAGTPEGVATLAASARPDHESAWCVKEVRPTLTLEQHAPGSSKMLYVLMTTCDFSDQFRQLRLERLRNGFAIVSVSTPPAPAPRRLASISCTGFSTRDGHRGLYTCNCCFEYTARQFGRRCGVRHSGKYLHTSTNLRAASN